jgi:hypothetical protein
VNLLDGIEIDRRAVDLREIGLAAMVWNERRSAGRAIADSRPRFGNGKAARLLK